MKKIVIWYGTRHIEQIQEESFHDFNFFKSQKGN